MADSEVTYCNARKKGNGDKLEKRDPGPEHEGDGYCSQTTSGGRCYMHGRDSVQPTTHGLYSFKRERLREKMSAADAMEQPGDLWTEVAVLRTLLSDYLEDVEEVDGDVLQDVKKIQGELRKTVNNIHEMLTRTRPTEAEVERMIDGFAQILREYVEEENRRDAALQDLQRLVGNDRPAALEDAS